MKFDMNKWIVLIVGAIILIAMIPNLINIGKTDKNIYVMYDLVKIHNPDFILMVDTNGSVINLTKGSVTDFKKLTKNVDTDGYSLYRFKYVTVNAMLIPLDLVYDQSQNQYKFEDFYGIADNNLYFDIEINNSTVFDVLEYNGVLGMSSVYEIGLWT